MSLKWILDNRHHTSIQVSSAPFLQCSNETLAKEQIFENARLHNECQTKDFYVGFPQMGI